MPGYQQYRKYQRQQDDKGFKIGKILIVLAIIFVIFLIGRAIFGSDPEVESILPNENTNVDSAGDHNANTNSEDTNSSDNSNTNSSVNINVDTSMADSFSMESCENLKSRGTTGEKQVSLTFNIGTIKEGAVQGVLDALAQNNAPADFFARGDVAEENSELIKKISNAGFAVYNLSYNHPHFNDLPASGISEQLFKAENQISAITGKTTKPFFRPPFGEADDDVVAVVTADGYCPVSWTVDAMDWSTEYSADQSKERVLSNVSNGAIILMQAANSVSAEILPGVISELKSSGYAIVDLNTLLK